MPVIRSGTDYEGTWHSWSEKKAEGYRLARLRQKESARVRYLMKSYGLKEADYNQMVEAQQGRCAVCGEVKKLHINHNHKTKRIRELLCTRCNMVLGAVGENQELLYTAAAYLKKHLDGVK